MDWGRSMYPFSLSLNIRKSRNLPGFRICLGTWEIQPNISLLLTVYMFNTSLVSVEQRYNLNSPFLRVRSGITAHPPHLLPLHPIILRHEERTVLLKICIVGSGLGKIQKYTQIHKYTHREDRKYKNNIHSPHLLPPHPIILWHEEGQ